MSKRRKNRKKQGLSLKKAVFVAVFAACVPFSTAFAQFPSEIDEERPQTLAELQDLPRNEIFEEIEENSALPEGIRNDAIREAALSYGARGGLAWRTYEIRKELHSQISYLDKVFDFRQLLIPAPSGLLIEPPVVSESINAMIIDPGGQEAAVADRIYDINKRAQIVSTARDWRNYLERDWGKVVAPPDVLRPNNEREREKFRKWVRTGWKMGITQADEIFNDDLKQLVSHYEGMVRYRKLLLQGMVSPPFAFQVDRGITGGGNSMRVGDRAVEITGPSELKPRANEWQPVNR